MNDPTVHIVDDDLAVRDSVSLLCETAGIRTVCYESAESFLTTYSAEMTGCLLLDVRMARMSGPELQIELARRECHLPIIFLTAYGDIPMTVRAMKAGAVDFMTKPVDGAELLERLQAALQTVQNQRTAAHENSREHDVLAQLTQRERETLFLVLAGHANKAIAKQLGISYRTVEIHRSHILRKTGATNMLELAKLVAE